VAVLGGTASVAGGRFVDEFKIPGTEAQRALDLLQSRFPQASGDTAAIVINAQSGIAVNTRRVFGEAKKAGLGRIIVINRMDSDNIDFSTLVDNIQELFGKACVLLNVPLGQGADFRGVASTLDVAADKYALLLLIACLSMAYAMWLLWKET